MPAYFDRVQETTTTSGNGTITLNGAVSGYRTFSSVFNGSNQVFYTVVDGAAWEVGQGTYSANTIARDRVFSSSNSNNKIILSGGTSIVFLDFPAIAIHDMGVDIAMWMCGVMQ